MGRWITTTTYSAQKEFEYSYHFLCQQCNKDSGNIYKKIDVNFEKPFGVSGYNKGTKLSPSDEAAFDQIVKSKMVTQIVKTYINVERRDYGFIAVCPHCGAKQQWKTKKKLFSKQPPEIDPKFLPVFDWDFAKFSPDMPGIIERVKKELPGLFTATGFLRDEYSDSNNAQYNFPYIVPGLRATLVNDLMGNDHPIQAMKYQLVRASGAPTLDEGEIAYGFTGHEKQWWVVVKQGFVVRTTES